MLLTAPAGPAVSSSAAKIGETSYDSLEDAIAAANASQKTVEVVLQKDHEGGVVELVRSIILNLGGHKIINTNSGEAAIVVKPDATTGETLEVTIKNGTVTGGEDSGIRIEGSEQVSPTVTLKDLTITDNTGTDGGGVHIESSNVTIDGCTITENEATGNGGGVYVTDNSTVTVVGGEISSNTSTGVEQTISGGGGLYTNNSTVTLDKVTITGNKAITDPRNDGGGILAAGSDLTITGSTITENTAPDCGGGLFLSHTNANITGSTIEGNQAAYGAGVYLNDSPDVAEADCTGSHTHNITGTKINRNTANTLGGGMYVGTKSNVTLTGSTLDGNATTDKTGGQGGAIVAYGAGDITLDSTTITNNDAAVGGGLFSLGFAVSDTHITLRNNTKFTGNTAASGAGIYLMRSSGNNILLELSDSAIDNNTASSSGGGIFAYDGVQINANKASFNGNKAANGAGIYLYGKNNKVMAELTDSFIDNNIASDWGGGIFAYNGAEVKANNTSISNNKGGNAGGLLVWNNSSAELSNGSKVCGNTATNGDGGGIYAFNGTVNATGSDISGNTANQDGGGVYAKCDTGRADNNPIQLKGNTITNNTGNNGGGIRLINVSATLEKNLIDGNYARNAGGGIRADTTNSGPSTICTLRGNTISNNSAVTGGGINSGSSSMIFAKKLVGHTCTILMESGEITNNIARTTLSGYGGGGVYLVGNGSRFIMQGGSITENKANCGGGIFSQNYRGVTIAGGTIQNNEATANGGAIYIQNALPSRTISCEDGKKLTNTVAEELLDIGETVVISGNHAGGLGGGIYAGNGVTVKALGFVLNNRADGAGDDLYLTAGSKESKNQNVLILRPVGDDWTLVQCGHPIDGWYLDGKDARWDADSQKKFVTNLDALLEGTDYMIEKGEGGSYIITIGSNALALKAAHDVPPEPKPDPDGPDTPTPNPNPKPEPKPGPDTPVTPEDPQLPPVQDARADTPDSPVLPSSPTNPAVQDAHALPQTGTSLFAALAMALSGFALTIAGAWASLLGKNSRH